ncbi:hypothetical protein Droror1_Dr00025800 [Drosera rotundifolia]
MGRGQLKKLQEENITTAIFGDGVNPNLIGRGKKEVTKKDDMKKVDGIRKDEKHGVARNVDGALSPGNANRVAHEMASYLSECNGIKDRCKLVPDYILDLSAMANRWQLDGDGGDGRWWSFGRRPEGRGVRGRRGEVKRGEVSGEGGQWWSLRRHDKGSGERLLGRRWEKEERETEQCREQGRAKEISNPCF